MATTTSHGTFGVTAQLLKAIGNIFQGIVIRRRCGVFSCGRVDF
jgi:hypothetical protein